MPAQPLPVCSAGRPPADTVYGRYRILSRLGTLLASIYVPAGVLFPPHRPQCAARIVASPVDIVLLREVKLSERGHIGSGTCQTLADNVFPGMTSCWISMVLN